MKPSKRKPAGRHPKPDHTDVLIRNLPDATRLPLEAQAQAAGISLTEHIRRILAAAAQKRES